MILYRVVGAAWQHFCHLSPLVAVGGVRQEERPLLVGHPLYLEDVGIEVIVPALAALLS
jgi:hypothetical protein